MAVRAGIYARISDDRTGEQAGVTRQEADCRALAARQGWDVAEVYVDNDLSASSYGRRPRPAYERLLEDMRARAVDAVVVWHEDRLHRQPRELEQFIDVANAARVHLATVTGEIDLATPEGRLRARMLGNVGAYESEHKAARIRRKHQELANAGKISGGGTRPFGYEKDRMTVDAPEAKLIRAAVKAVLGGASIRSIADDWQRRGVRSPAGNAFGPNAVRRLLRSGRIAGMREHHGEIVGKAVWPAIIPQAQHERVRALLSDPTRLTRRAGRRYLLGSFATCGKCDAGLRSRPNTHGTRLYICKTGVGQKGCGGIAIVAEKLEELVAEQVFFRVDTPELAKAIAQHHAAPERADEIADDEAQLTMLAEDFAQRRIGRAEWLRARDVIQARLDDARRRLARANGTQALGGYIGREGALRRAWPDMGLEERRAVLRALVDRIVIGPAKRKNPPADANGRRKFDPSRVRLVWRF